VKVVSHGRYVTFEVAVSRQMFAEIRPAAGIARASMSDVEAGCDR
jgi:hypothetical protein